MPSATTRLAAVLLCGAISTATAQTSGDSTQYGDEIYRPDMGQPGKNVIWIPTPDTLVTKMLQAAKTTSNDVVYDLGSGDGKIPIAAARDFKARAVGIEYNPDLAALAHRNAERAGGCRQGQDHCRRHIRERLLRRIVPAAVSGRWQLEEGGAGWKGTLDLIQAYQRVGGNLTVSRKALPLLGPSLSGADFSLSSMSMGRCVRFAASSTATGSMRLDGYDTPVSGRRIAHPPRIEAARR